MTPGTWYARQTPERRAAVIARSTENNRRLRADRHARGECIICTEPAAREGSRVFLRCAGCAAALKIARAA